MKRKGVCNDVGRVMMGRNWRHQGRVPPDLALRDPAVPWGGDGGGPRHPRRENRGLHISRAQVEAAEVTASAAVRGLTVR